MTLPPKLGFDPRLTPIRPDLAASHLEGILQAPRYVQGKDYEVIAPTASVRRQPSPEVYMDTQALYGEHVTVYEITKEGWAWGQLKNDGYVGYLPASALALAQHHPSHKVCVPATFIFPGPNIKFTPRMAISLGAFVKVENSDETFAYTRDGAIYKDHLTTIEHTEKDHVDVALKFLEVPYLWGGKSSAGIDCSGLVQIALHACGQTCPRDSDMQENAAFTRCEKLDYQRGDLIFWSGHVGIVTAPNRLLHANAHHMRVAEEPLSEAIARIAAKGLEVRTLRRKS
jgi:cell wall-associated NlpC family hydrolase